MNNYLKEIKSFITLTVLVVLVFFIHEFLYVEIFTMKNSPLNFNIFF